jgi:hypothetical protein
MLSETGRALFDRRARPLGRASLARPAQGAHLARRSWRNIVKRRLFSHATRFSDHSERLVGPASKSPGRGVFIMLPRSNPTAPRPCRGLNARH